MTGMEKWVKVTSLDFKVNSYYTQNWGNISFLGQKLTLHYFSLNMFIRFLWNVS